MKHLIDKKKPPKNEGEYEKHRRELNDKRYEYLAKELEETKSLIYTIIADIKTLRDNHLEHVMADIREIKEELSSLANKR